MSVAIGLTSTLGSIFLYFPLLMLVVVTGTNLATAMSSTPSLSTFSCGVKYCSSMSGICPVSCSNRVLTGQTCGMNGKFFVFECEPSTSTTITSTTITTTTATTTTTKTTTSTTSTSSTTTRTTTTTTIQSGASAYCMGSAPNAPISAPPHGIYAASDQGIANPSVWDYITNTVMKNNTDCGLVLLVHWSNIEPQKGVYNWSYINQSVAPFVKAGKSVAFVLVGNEEGTVHELNGQYDTPQWVLNSVPYIPAGVCAPFPEPVFWNKTYESDIQQFETTFENHIASSSFSSSVSYIRWGFTQGGEDEVPYRNNAVGSTCYNDWVAQGYSTTSFSKFINDSINWVGKQNFPYWYFVDMAPVPGGPQEAVTAANWSTTSKIGLAYQGLAKTSFPSGCSDQSWCATFKKYLNMPDEMQFAAVDPCTNITSDLLTAISNHASVFELNAEPNNYGDWYRCGNSALLPPANIVNPAT